MLVQYKYMDDYCSICHFWQRCHVKMGTPRVYIIVKKRCPRSSGGAVAVALVSQANDAGSIPVSALALYFIFPAFFSEKFLSFSAGSIALEKVVQLPDQ